MKVFTLMSIVVSTFAFSGHLNAAVTDPTANINTCLASARTDAEQNRCYALDNCIRNQSSGREQLRECFFQAEEKYRVEQGLAERRIPAAPVASSYVTGTTPVATEVPDSDYSIKGGDAKGWKNSTQGD